MNTHKRINSVIAASLLSLVCVGSASAVSLSAGSFADLLGKNGVSATFTGGPGGTLYIPSAPGIAGIPVQFVLDPTHNVSAIFTFTPVTATSAATFAAGKAFETTTGGSFKIANGATTYLAGNFSQGVMGVANGGTTVAYLSAAGNDVTYTSGTFLAPAGLQVGNIGSFNISFSGANSGAGTGVSVGTYINQFVSRGASATFSGVPGTHGGNGGGVPEPGSVAVLMIGGLFLAGAVLRRQTSTARFAA